MKNKSFGRLLRIIGIVILCISYIVSCINARRWYRIIGLAIFLLFALLYIREEKNTVPPGIDTRSGFIARIKAIRNRDSYFNTASLFTSMFTPFRSPLEKDVDDILRFNKSYSGQQTFPELPMRTLEGARLWQYYQGLCLKDSIDPQLRQNVELLAVGGWMCTCGRVNPSYTSTCVCGTAKRNVPQKKPKPKSTHWQCTCGRENPNYTSTCVCGGNKRDLQNKL